MGKLYLRYLWLCCSLFLISGLKGQVVSVTNPTNTTPNLNATYSSLADAITDLNAITVISGPVTITLNPGNPQTSISGGYVISFAATTSAINHVVLEGSNNTITAFTPQTSGRLTDAFFKIIGSDFITIKNFTLQENPGNIGFTPASNTMTEWGIALLYASTSNGAQNNSLLNNVISLNKTYRNTFGIYSNNNHSPTVVTTSAPITDAINGPNSNNKIYGNSISNVNMGICVVGSSVAAYMDTGNDIGGTSTITGNTISNWGGLAQSPTFINSSGTGYGIFINNQKGENASYNTISSAAVTGMVFTFRGIFKSYNTVPTGTFISTIANNTISLNSGFSSGTLEGIRSEGISSPLSTATIQINNNSFLNNNITAVGATQGFTGISNTSQVGTLNINNNIFRNNSSTATTIGNLFTAITNTGLIQNVLNINNNSIGDGLGNAFICSAATTGTMIGITCPTIAATASASISGNNFQGFAQVVAGSGAHTYISLIHSPSGASTDNLNSNTFTNLIANTSGSITFINRTGSMGLNAGHTENCSNNSIVTGFSKPVAGGTILLYNSTSSSLSGNTLIHNGNNFSNISTGSAIMGGWNNIDGGASAPQKIFNNNIFQNWNHGNTGSNPVTVVQINNGGNNTQVQGNIIDGIQGNAAVRGISLGGTTASNLYTVDNNSISNLAANNGAATALGAGSVAITNMQISRNKIFGISANASSVVAMSISTGGSNTRIFQNNLYDLSLNNAAGFCYGISISNSAAGAYQIDNNTIGNLFAPIADGFNAITAIIATSVAASCSYLIAYNSIYLNASSTGSGFGSSGMYLSGSSTATNGAAILRNNIVVNRSTATGGGLTAVIRRSNVQLANFSSTSNNNIYYAGAPSAANLIFTDGIVFNQTLSEYKTTVGPTRESGSFTELPPFLSTIGSSANFLHLNPAIATQAESGAQNITGITSDFDTDIRQGNAGYLGTGTAPDIGADEVEGIFTELNPPVIVYTSLSTPLCSSGNRTLSGVTVTDATGVPLSGANRPRIYYRKNAGTWFSQPGTNTSGTATNSVWTFTIVVADMGGVTDGDQVQYYVAAQDLVSIPNTGSFPSSGFAATGVNSISNSPTAPDTYDILYDLNGAYTVGIGGDFATVTDAAFAYNNACSLSGNILFVLIDDLYPSETFPITFNKHPDASAANNLTIRPSLTATPTITGSSALPIINFNGAVYVSFDGRQGGSGSTKSLAISNTGSGITIQFTNDAKNDAVRYCLVKGQRVSAFSGTIYFGTANPTGSGNDNNTINNNAISEAGGFSNNAIYSAGTNFKGNDNNIVSNNQIFNYYNAANNSNGIYINSNSSGWTITGNRLYQTAARVYTATTEHYGIQITNGSGYTINNNSIGFADENGNGQTVMIGNSVTLAGFPTSYTVGGTPTSIRYLGIACSFDLFGSASAINGNTIGGIAMFTSNGNATLNGMFCGIYVESGTANIGNLSGNTIGSATGNNSIYVTTTTSGGTVVGIRAACTGSVLLQNNLIGGILASGAAANICAGITGISIAGNAGFTLSNNSIGNVDAANMRMGYAVSGSSLSSLGNLQATSGTGANFAGITCSVTGSNATINNNILRGWSVSGSFAGITGIVTSNTMSFSASLLINNNQLGTGSTGWLNYVNANSGGLGGIVAGSSGTTTLQINSNQFRGMSYNTGATNTGANKLITLSAAVNSNHVADIQNNRFHDLNLQVSNFTGIYTSYQMPSTATRNIVGNSIVGTLTVNSLGGGAIWMIQNIGNSVGQSQSNIRDNDFSNITVTATGNYTYTAIEDFDGNNTVLGCPTKRITGNRFANWTGGKGDQFVMLTGQFGSVAGPSPADSVSRNLVENISTEDGFLYGIAVGYINPMDANELVIDRNQVSGLRSLVSGGDVTGLLLGNYVTASNGVLVTSNRMDDFQSTAANAKIYGIHDLSLSGQISLAANKIFNLQGNGTAATVNGIRLASAATSSVYNNLIGDLKSALFNNSSEPAVTGIYIETAVQASVYNNSVHLSATGGSTNFSTAAIFSTVLVNTDCRNNILSNLSVPGSGGKTVAFWRDDANLVNFTGDYNSLYSGTPSANRLLFFDGTNAIQTLTAYQAIMAPLESQTVTGIVSFLSTIGTDNQFLHLDPNQNCQILGKGNNSVYLLAGDVDGDSRMTVAPFLTDMGADETGETNVWTGSVSTAWNNALNWSLGQVPNTSTSAVAIPTGATNMPTIAIGETFEVRYLQIGVGALLNLYGTLKLSGYLSAPASGINTINTGVVYGSLDIAGTCDQQFNLSGNNFSSNSLKNLILRTNVLMASGVTNELNVFGGVTFEGVAGKVLGTSDNLVLKSTVSATAYIGDLSGNQVNGKVTVERFINTGLLADGRHPKGWQFLATPVKGQTIFESWQENGSATNGLGTIITGTGTGFDLTTAQPSMKYFDATLGASGNWQAVNQTGNPIYDQRGYLLFVRGDRTVVTYNGTPNPTTLRTKGTIMQPVDPPPVTTVLPGKLASVGNPYASAIDVNYLRSNGFFSNLNNDVLVWDPLLAGTYGYGGYQTLSAANNYEPTAGGTAYYPAGVSAPDIQSGQAFFVRSSGLAGSVVFTEACKLSNSRLVNRTTSSVNSSFFRAALFTHDGHIADGNAVVFHAGYRDGIDADDGIKFLNSGENFFLSRDSIALAVEAKSNVTAGDTIFYQMNNLRQQSYQLRFSPENFDVSTLRAWLVDQYLHTETPVSLLDSSKYVFQITADPLSAAANRFYVVFRAGFPVDIQLTLALHTPAGTGLNWKVNREEGMLAYFVEYSTDGMQYQTVAGIAPKANNGVLTLYEWYDSRSAATNFYRIRAQNRQGDTLFSNIVKWEPERPQYDWSVYPNPLAGSILTLTVPEGLEEAITLNWFDASGKLLGTNRIQTNDQNRQYTFPNNRKLPSGVYYLRITGNSGLLKQIKLLKP